MARGPRCPPPRPQSVTTARYHAAADLLLWPGTQETSRPRQSELLNRNPNTTASGGRRVDEEEDAAREEEEGCRGLRKLNWAGFNSLHVMARAFVARAVCSHGATPPVNLTETKLGM
jgi:hypothetical protein